MPCGCLRQEFYVRYDIVLFIFFLFCTVTSYSFVRYSLYRSGCRVPRVVVVVLAGWFERTNGIDFLSSRFMFSFCSSCPCRAPDKNTPSSETTPHRRISIKKMKLPNNNIIFELLALLIMTTRVAFIDAECLFCINGESSSSSSCSSVAVCQSSDIFPISLNIILYQHMIIYFYFYSHNCRSHPRGGRWRNVRFPLGGGSIPRGR